MVVDGHINGQHSNWSMNANSNMIPAKLSYNTGSESLILEMLGTD